jgi:hypothetical protein
VEFERQPYIRIYMHIRILFFLFVIFIDVIQIESNSFKEWILFYFILFYFCLWNEYPSGKKNDGKLHHYA